MELRSAYIRLDCAALHLARDIYPTIGIQRYLRRLDEMAEMVAARRPGLSATLRYQAMRETLVDDCGLTGNHEDYYNPENSYLNRVLDTGAGIPISLSVVWIEVARRLKWPVGGVALPGHFIVRFDDPERYVLADPFNDGDSLSIADCRRLVQEQSDGHAWFSPDQLRVVSTRGVLVRMLRNLRNIYLVQNNLPLVATTLRRLAAVQPRNGQHLQELAAVCTRQGDVRGAYAHLALYLHREPDAHDSKLVRRNLKQLGAALLARN